jgi:hypothetical protein
MTMTSPTTSAEAVAALDPHGLAGANEVMADETELRARGISGTWLRLARRRRKVRYIDTRPNEKPGTGAEARYRYCLRDVLAERARIDAAQAPSTPTSPKPREAPPIAAHARATPPEAPPPTLPEPRRRTAATLRGPMPEVMIMRRRVGGTTP